MHRGRILFIHNVMASVRILPWASVGSVLVLAAACLPHPKGDYEDFLENTKDQRTGSATDAAAPRIDGSAPKANFKNVAFAVCSSPLAAGDMTKTFRFFVDTDYKAESNGGGKADILLTAFKTTARTFARSETAPEPIKFLGTTIGANARFSPSTPVAIIPGAGNPNSGRDIEINNLALTGVMTEQAKFCFSFSGKAVKPIQLDFEATCLVFEMKEGDKFDFSAATDKVLIPSLNLELTEDKFVCN